MLHVSCVTMLHVQRLAGGRGGVWEVWLAGVRGWLYREAAARSTRVSRARQVRISDIIGENIPPCQPVTNLTSFVHRAAKMTDISGPWMEVNCILFFSPPRLQIFAVFSAPRRHSFLHRPPTGKIFVSQSGRKYLNERESIWLLSQPIYHFTSVYTMIEFSVYDRYRPCS